MIMKVTFKKCELNIWNIVEVNNNFSCVGLCLTAFYSMQLPRGWYQCTYIIL